MPMPANRFEDLAARQAQSDGVRALFEQLANRASQLQALKDDLQKVIVRNREARTGRAFRFSRRQRSILSDFEKDAENSVRGLPAQVARLGDAGLLTVAWRNEELLLATERRLYKVFREEDKLAADRILRFRQETLGVIREFIENSKFKDVIPLRKLP